MKFRTVSSLIAIASFVLLNASCQMSLEEAKKVTLTTTERSFAAPPRKANDINDLLKKKGVFESRETATMKEKADMEPPADASDGELKDFYEDRGFAAHQLGRYKQALVDLRKAYAYLQKTGGQRTILANTLSVAESEMGNYKAAIDILLRESPKVKYPWAMYSHLTQYYASTGDVDSARRMNEMCRTECTSFRMSGTRKAGAVAACEAQLDRSNGWILQAEGKHAQAEVAFRNCHHYWMSLKDTRPRDAITSRMPLITSLIAQNKLLEAEQETRTALDQALDHVERDSALTGRILNELVNIIRREGRLEEAENLSGEVIRILEAARVPTDSLLMCNARSQQGNILFARDDFRGVAAIYDQVKVDMRSNRYLFDKHYLRNRNIMVSLIKAGRAVEALDMVTSIYESDRKIFGDGHYSTAEALGIRGMANASLGKSRDAYNDFSAALPVLLGRNLGRLSNPDMRKRVALVYEAYIDFLSGIRGSGQEREYNINAVAESYRIANALSGYSLTGAVSESTARSAAAYDPELADLVRREQDAGKEIRVLQDTISDLMAAPGDEVTAKGIGESRARLETVTRARTAILDEIQKRFPKYSDYIEPPLPSIELTQKSLRPGEALLSIYTTDDRTFTWAIPKSGDARFAVSPLGKKELAGVVSKLREALDSHPSVLGDIPDYDVSSAYDLYSRLLRPVEGGFKDASDILAVVRGPLSQLPLSTLTTGPSSLSTGSNALFEKYRAVPWLARKASVAILPSVSSLVTLRSLPAGDPGRRAFAGFGDPIFSRKQLAASEKEGSAGPAQLAGRGVPLQIRSVRTTIQGNMDAKQINSIKMDSLKRLPDTATEIMDTARALNADPAHDVFLGKNASRHQVRTMNLSDRRVISFATHALVPGDLDGLEEPALALSAPAVTGNPDDGLLMMGEIVKLKLNADWVVLSACNTGAAEGGGNEALTGLCRAFFYAGTRSVLASMWPVETTSARKLISDTFRNQQADKTLSRARALNKSMLGLIDNDYLVDKATGKAVASYAHPFFWAPFIAVGDPGD